MDQQKIGEYLKDLRKEMGLTQEQLADKFFVSRRTVSRWETGANLPEIDIMIELADFYSVDLKELLTGERKENNMEEEMKETAVAVAEYTNEEKIRLTRVARGTFAAGALALSVYLALQCILPDGYSTPVMDFLQGMVLGIAFGALIFGLIYNTALGRKIFAAKSRLWDKAKKS